MSRRLQPLRRAREIFIREDGPVSPDVANASNLLSRVAEALAQYKRAEEYARQAWEIMERLGDRCTGACAEHIRIEALNNLGNALRAQGRYAEAEEWLLRAARPAAEYEMDATVVLNSLGVLYKYTGRFDEAEQLYQKVLDKTSHAGFRAS